VKDIDQILTDAREFDRKLLGNIRRAVASTTTVVTQKARNEHRWKDVTYATRESISGEVVDFSDGAEGKITAGENAVRLNDGTAPHDIRPKAGEGFQGPMRQGQSRRDKADIGTNRSALRFVVGGRVVFAKVVHHPGTSPDPFLDAAERAADQDLAASVGEAIDQAIGE
jgi:hypothetical protein